MAAKKLELVGVWACETVAELEEVKAAHWAGGDRFYTVDFFRDDAILITIWRFVE